jgi:hypothetical protein
MMVKRILSMAAALAAAFTFTITPVSADDDDSPVVITFNSDSASLTNNSEPALSFDSESYADYIHLTRDAEKAGLKMSQDKDTYYQGVSLKVSASTSGVDGYFPCSGAILDDDNNQVYPDAPESDDTDNMSIIGVELHAEDFGLTCFDGCFINFAYRLTEDDETALEDSSIWVYSADDNSARQGNATKLTVNTTLDDNVTQYRDNATVSVPVGSDTTGSSTKIIFEIPVSGAVDGEVLYLDNIKIQLPGSEYIANVDGYNANAAKRETVDTLKITKKGNTDGLDGKVEKSSTKTSPVVVVVIVVAVLVVGAAIFFIIKKFRHRFY